MNLCRQPSIKMFVRTNNIDYVIGWKTRSIHVSSQAGKSHVKLCTYCIGLVVIQVKMVVGREIVVLKQCSELKGLLTYTRPTMLRW